MSQSRVLQQHIAQLKEIRGVLHALKNMAFMEVHKLNRLQQAQDRVVRHIAEVSADFLHFYTTQPFNLVDAPAVLVIIGSERGFCGNFNDSLIAHAENLMPADIFAIGARLNNRLQNKNIASTALPGASTHDEITEVLGALSTAVADLQLKHEVIRLMAIYHHGDHANIIERPLLPPFSDIELSTIPKNQPLLNLPPEQFLFELVDQYLLSSLQDILLASLNAENNQRLQHLDNAIKHLDQETARLNKLTQIHRQEEITEEIEVILLNAENQA